MFTTYAYDIEGPAVAFRGTLKVEFNYAEGCSGRQFYVEPSVNVLRVSANSADIIDSKGRIGGQVELLTEEQRATRGEVVLADKSEAKAIEDACVQAGREQSTPEAVGAAAADRRAG